VYLVDTRAGRLTPGVAIELAGMLAHIAGGDGRGVYTIAWDPVGDRLEAFAPHGGWYKPSRPGARSAHYFARGEQGTASACGDWELGLDYDLRGDLTFGARKCPRCRRALQEADRAG
jgi:hypothetical protein